MASRTQKMFVSISITVQNSYMYNIFQQRFFLLLQVTEISEMDTVILQPIHRIHIWRVSRIQSDKESADTTGRYHYAVALG